ncbi:hypothetical protein Salat_1464400 [Sesamum alatum]|uniref:Uncharacterized protein n=1 Tax=Sesamum alatum TaxID=300844 RepID=A0AAE1YB12_9LAMI|nr:hypothetical protein Salat_1464400 [Sesamum alatum]
MGATMVTYEPNIISQSTAHLEVDANKVDQVEQSTRRPISSIQRVGLINEPNSKSHIPVVIEKMQVVNDNKGECVEGSSSLKLAEGRKYDSGVGGAEGGADSEGVDVSTEIGALPTFNSSMYELSSIQSFSTSEGGNSSVRGTIGAGEELGLG